MLMEFSSEMVLILAMLGMMAWSGILMRRELARSRECEARLRQSDAMSRSTLESMVHAVITLATPGRIVDANQSARKLFGYETAGDLIGRSIDELILKEGSDPSLAAYLQALRGDFKEWGREVKARRKDGSQFRARVSIGDHGVGKMRIFTVTVRDLARSSEIAALRASENQLRLITDAVPDLIAYIDIGRRYRFHNGAYMDILGLQPEQVDGRTMAEIFGAEMYEFLRPKVDEVLSGYPVRFERTLVDVHGEKRRFATHYFPRYSEDPGAPDVIGFYTISTDITERTRIDRMKDEFVSMVSHELRTPLTSIRGSLGLLTGGVAGMLPDAARNLVDIAKNNCERLIRLINDILDTEKMESGKMRFDQKVVELEPLLAQSIAANEGFALQLKVTFRLLGSAAPVRVNVDSDGVTQVLTNLLSNAAKFSPPGASVEVALTRAQGRVRVEVRDHGPGIPEEFRSRIFGKFSQADSSNSRQQGGTGLGLNISKAIVERLGGMMGFTTQTGLGTTFFFELPEWQEAPSSVFASPAREMKRPCVLVCEDDPDIARLIGMMLDKAGYDTDLAFTAARARELAVASPYAAMTVDLKLPDQDGISLMRALRGDERTRNLPIVVVSAISDMGRIQLNSETLTVSDWLGKPIDANRLVLAIRDAVAGRTKDRPRILHVEDDPDIQHISAAIARDFATFEFAATLEEARARLLSRKYDLVVLDLNLAEGEGSGWNLIADIDALVPVPPVVVFSARDVSQAEAARVAAVLMKAHTTNDQFLETIERVLDRGRQAPSKSPGAPIAQAA